MDYEKKYKESKAKMVEFLNKYNGFTISPDGEMYKELQGIFPELAESEDERIRKGLIDYIKSELDDIRHIAAQNHIEGGYEDEENILKEYIAWLEKQGEQNLANSAKTCKEEQNPAWSEEDGQYLLVCKNALAKYQTTDKWDAGIISHWLEDKLKSIKDRVQPKVEWSEEDNAMLDNIVAWIDGKWGTLGGKVGGKEAYISFLKSIQERYTWKPSDEQIEALKYSLGEGGTYNKEALMSLLTDLSGL